MTGSLASDRGMAVRPTANPKRWWVLAVISLATLMVVLDATIVNVALPHAQVRLGMRQPTGRA